MEKKLNAAINQFYLHDKVKKVHTSKFRTKIRQTLQRILNLVNLDPGYFNCWLLNEWSLQEVIFRSNYLSLTDFASFRVLLGITHIRHPDTFKNVINFNSICNNLSDDEWMENGNLFKKLVAYFNWQNRQGSPKVIS